MNERIKEIVGSSLGRLKRCNCFQSLGVIKNKISRGKMEIVEGEKVVLIVEKKEVFNELFYFLLDGCDLEQEFEQFRDKLLRYENLVMHHTSKEDVTNFVIADKLGLKQYKIYKRKQLINKNGSKINEQMDVKEAEITDLESVYMLLKESLDPLSDDLVTDKELQDYIGNKQVLVFSEGQEIKGTLVFEDTGVKTYIRAVCVKQKDRGKKIGEALIIRYYNLHVNHYKVFTLWVRADNEAANRMYDKFGYQEDGLTDYIYRRN